MAIRKALGGALIRLAHSIYRPTVTVHPMDAHVDRMVREWNNSAMSEQEYMQRLHSRGWN